VIKPKLQAIFSPEQYHGWGKSRRYFEGWYYKVINADESKALAIIPGIAMDEKGAKQSFIQVLDGKNKTAEYLRFEADDFIPAPGKFEIQIANNYFSMDQIKLDLNGLRGSLNFTGRVPWPTSWKSPGIMGPYSFVPFMECYHGILSMDHEVSGVLNYKGNSIIFDGGRGYMEKDWGKSFPSAYTWMQTNHFSKPGISFKVSVAKIPWLGSSFVGFIAGLWTGGRLFQFTTYNSTKLTKCLIDNNKVVIDMENRNHVLRVFARREEATELASPIMGLMDGKIEESMNSEIRIQLFDKKNNIIIFDDTGKNAALEVAGKIEEILMP